jgi:hypothetical protein
MISCSIVINGIFVKNGAVLLVQCKDHTYISAFGNTICSQVG